MDIDKPEFMDYFLDLSVVVTGFSRFDLEGTGQASLYFDTIRKVIGDDIFGELLQTFHEIDQSSKDASNSSALDEGVSSDILMSGKLGPIARNIIKLWYIATWEELPLVWRERFGVRENDHTFIVSLYAYPEGLLWPAIGVNPPAAKAPGYGTWSNPPSLTLS